MPHILATITAHPGHVTDEITSGHPRLLLLLVAALFDGFASLSTTSARMTPRGGHSQKATEDRDATTYCMWLTSLGVDSGNDILDACKTGLPLLTVESLLDPSSINWRKVLATPAGCLATTTAGAHTHRAHGQPRYEGLSQLCST